MIWNMLIENGLRKEENMESEFGKGLTYCIGLFLCHSERHFDESEGAKNAREITGKIYGDYGLWFNGAADHLFDLEIPNNLPDPLIDDIKEWRSRCLFLKMHPANKVDFEHSIKKAKEFLLRIDEHFGVETIQAEWS